MARWRTCRSGKCWRWQRARSGSSRSTGDEPLAGAPGVAVAASPGPRLSRPAAAGYAAAVTREDFWDQIDTARSAAMFDRARLADALRDELLELDEDEVLEFARHFADCRVESYRQELFAAAWIAGGGAAEDDFSDFRDWLITLGREAFDDVLHDPQRILNHADPVELRDPFDRAVGRVPAEAYEELTGEPLPSDSLRPHPREPTGRKWDPAGLPRRYPKLWRAYNPE